MKRIAQLVLIAIGLTASLSGCLRPPIMKPTVQVFSALDQGDAIKRLIVLPYNDQQSASLEWKTYAAKIEARFAKAGYTVTHDAAQAQLVAFFGYGIDAGQEVLTNYAIRQYGVTGYNSATHFQSLTCEQYCVRGLIITIVAVSCQNLAGPMLSGFQHPSLADDLASLVCAAFQI